MYLHPWIQKYVNITFLIIKNIIESLTFLVYIHKVNEGFLLKYIFFAPTHVISCTGPTKRLYLYITTGVYFLLIWTLNLYNIGGSIIFFKKRGVAASNYTFVHYLVRKGGCFNAVMKMVKNDFFLVKLSDQKGGGGGYSPPILPLNPPMFSVNMFHQTKLHML